VGKLRAAAEEVVDWLRSKWESQSMLVVKLQGCLGQNPADSANSTSVCEATTMITTNGMPNRRGFLLGVLLRQGVEWF
jgi:hypothetical protein